MSTIHINHLTTGYMTRHGKSVITEDINASLNPGELTCLLGPNGAGKSTMLRTLSAFQPPIAGEILIDDKSITAYRPSQLSHIIGVVLTERINLDNMSVRELVGMGRSPYTGFWGRLSLEDKVIVDNAIKLVGIENLSGRMIQTLSDGERQKVMIAKALAQETPIIFLDEPTAFLDYPSKVEIMQLLLRLAHEENKTVFLSTHDLELALQIADKIWLIDKQNGLETGVPEDLALAGAMTRYFKRDGITFDMSSGLFKIENTPNRKISLSGDRESNRYRMLCKALYRRNYLVQDVLENCETTVPSVEISMDGFVVNNNIRCSTIEEVLEVVS